MVVVTIFVGIRWGTTSAIRIRIVIVIEIVIGIVVPVTAVAGGKATDGRVTAVVGGKVTDGPVVTDGPAAVATAKVVEEIARRMVAEPLLVSPRQ